jgi:hypothetical protein
MRPAAACFCLALVLASSGCDYWRRQFNSGGGGDQGRIPAEVPPVEQIVTYLNDNAARIKAVQCNTVQIDAKQGLQGVGLDGIMVCEKPRNFRLRARAFGQPQVDIGSNKDEFWFWVGKSDLPGVCYCSYTDLSRGGVRLPFPFQPDMVITALGISEYETGKKYDLRPTRDTLELTEQVVGADGQPLYKVTVFNRAEVRPPRPQVMGYVLRDMQGRDACRVEVLDTQLDPNTNAVLPLRVKLSWPAQKMEMTMKLTDMKAITNAPQQAFFRNDLANIPSFNLARGQLDGPGGYGQGMSLQRTGGGFPTPR